MGVGRAAARRRTSLAAAAAVCLVGIGEARAYVRYRTEAGLPFHWPRVCIGMRVYPDDLPDMTPEQIMGAAQGAAAAWSAAANPCSYVDIVVERAAGPGPQTRHDGVNTITFQRTSWCGPTDQPGACSYDPSATAISSVYVARNTGEIRDADIEVNAKNFLWGDIAMQAAAKQDLQSALTHEMGHVLGFDHTCFTRGAPGEALIDDMGNPVPDCDTAPPAVRETTMFPAVMSNDVSKRTLEPDDQRALCETYASADAGAPAGDAGLPSFAACAAPLDGGAPDADAGARPSPDAQSHAEAGDDAPTTLPAASNGCTCTIGETGSGPGAVLLALLAFVGYRRRPSTRDRKD